MPDDSACKQSQALFNSVHLLKSVPGYAPQVAKQAVVHKSVGDGIGVVRHNCHSVNERNIIDHEGCLTFTLYRGTSTRFRQAIEQHGLGATRDEHLFNLSVLEAPAVVSEPILRLVPNSICAWQYRDSVFSAPCECSVVP